MNPLASSRPLAHPVADSLVGGAEHGRRSALFRSTVAKNYLVVSLIMLAGWMLRDYNPIDGSDRVGYWLGIIGTSAMAVMLIYPLRKRLRWMRGLGSVHGWFRWHMMLGIVGPLLILFHCNFRVHALNSKIALYSMLIVAGSGVLGRHLYARIHHGLYGRHLTVKELQDALNLSIERGDGLYRFCPHAINQLRQLNNQVLTGPTGLLQNLLWPLRWTIETRWEFLSLLRSFHSELRQQVKQNPIIAAQRRHLTQTARRYFAQHLQRMRRLAGFTFFERLFALWHLFHLPLFLLMAVAVIWHIVAVHMY